MKRFASLPVYLVSVMAVRDKTSRLIDRQEDSERLRSCLPSVHIPASASLHAKQTRVVPEIGALTRVNARHPGRETGTGGLSSQSVVL